MTLVKIIYFLMAKINCNCYQAKPSTFLIE